MKKKLHKHGRILTRADKVSLYFFELLFPTLYKELVWLNKEYRKAQDATQEKQNELQEAQREIRKLKRGK